MTTISEIIEQERIALGLAPWQLAPAEADDGPCPWPANTAGYAAWHEAVELRRRLLADDPSRYG